MLDRKEGGKRKIRQRGKKSEGQEGKGGDKGKEKEGEGRKPEKERRKANKKPAKDSGVVQEGGTRIEETTCRWKGRRGLNELEG